MAAVKLKWNNDMGQVVSNRLMHSPFHVSDKDVA